MSNETSGQTPAPAAEPISEPTAEPAAAPHGHRQPSHRGWRSVSVFVFLVAGGLFATTSINAKGLDLRAASITDLPGVVRQERERSDDLQRQVADLNREIDQLSHRVDDREVTELQRQVDALLQPAGVAAVTGPGLEVVLDDAPADEIDKAGGDSGVSLDELVVHQQDIQAVVNALWAGGAEAMSIQGVRVISTTGIKCVGNTVVLNGVPYSPPYRIEAIGDPAELQASLDASAYIDAYLTAVEAYDLGYEVTPSARLELPEFEGSLTLEHAVADTSAQTGRD